MSTFVTRPNLKTPRRRSRSAFTLIELLVVIGIIAILSIVVVLTLNPGAMLQQSRDQNRLSDMDTLTHALGLYQTDAATLGTAGPLGTSSIVYVSLPDSSSTCGSWNLPILPMGYAYHCSPQASYRKTDSSGWIPVNFSGITTGSPLGQLPIDPTNASSSRLYYTYTTNGIQYEVMAPMESSKYKLGGTNDEISNDGGTLASAYEKGSKLGLEPLDYGDPSLVGLWTFDEGVGSTTYDYSGSNATGSWQGTPTGTSGYYSPGKVGSWAGAFDGSDNYVSMGANSLPLGSSPMSIVAWIYPTNVANQSVIAGYGTRTGSTAPNMSLQLLSGILRVDGRNVAFQSTLTVTPNQWHFVGVAYNGGGCSSMVVWVDNQSQLGSYNACSPSSILLGTGYIGAATFDGSGPVGNFFSGSVDDVRIYNRALSAAEIAAMYAGGK